MMNLINLFPCLMFVIFSSMSRDHRFGKRLPPPRHTANHACLNHAAPRHVLQ